MVPGRGGAVCSETRSWLGWEAHLARARVHHCCHRHRMQGQPEGWCTCGVKARWFAGQVQVGPCMSTLRRAAPRCPPPMRSLVINPLPLPSLCRLLDSPALGWPRQRLCSRMERLLAENAALLAENAALKQQLSQEKAGNEQVGTGCAWPNACGPSFVKSRRPHPAPRRYGTTWSAPSGPWIEKCRWAPAPPPAAASRASAASVSACGCGWPQHPPRSCPWHAERDGLGDQSGCDGEHDAAHGGHGRAA